MSESTNLPKLLTATQAAALIGVNPATIYKACRDGNIVYWHLPNSLHRRFEPADVLAFRERMRVDPADTLNQRLAKLRAVFAAKAAAKAARS